MPAGSYEGSPQQALQSARRLGVETNCSAVKREGGETMAAQVSEITGAGIAVMYHLPQSRENEGILVAAWLGKTRLIQNLEIAAAG